MTIALTQIVRLSDGIWSWMVEYDDGHLGRCGREASYAAADRVVRAIVEGVGK